MYATEMFIVVLEATFCWFSHMNSKVLVYFSVSGRKSLLSVSIFHTKDNFGVLLMKIINTFSSLGDPVPPKSAAEVAVILRY